MKNSRYTKRLGCALAVVLASSLHAEAPVMRDAATSEQLTVALQRAQNSDPMKKLKSAPIVVDPSVANRPKSLLAESDIISFQGFATLVPKRAILQIPKGFSERLKLQPGVQLQTWNDFYALNRGWITTIEVSRGQAEGSLPLAKETTKQMSKSGNLIVAVYMAGPISVLPPQEAEVTTTTAVKLP